MSEKSIKYWELFLKQQNGSITPDELVDLNSWKDQDADNAKLFKEFNSIYSNSNDGLTPDFNPEENWNELQSMIKVDTDTNATKTIRLFPWIARTAAAVILILGFTFIYYQYKNIPEQDLNFQAIVQTDDSGIKVVNLPDGSTVWLNRNSELLYPEVFDGSTRTLYLKGEAFFEVQPDENKPFTVHSGSSKTTVLGTSFNLRAYGKEDEIKLTVVTGKVAFTLADEKEGVIVTPGDMAVLTNESLEISQSENLDRNFLSWKTGELVFDDSPLGQLIDALEKHYNINIGVDNQQTLNCRFTGNFKETEIENTIKVITRAIGATYKKNEDSYQIQSSGCK